MLSVFSFFFFGFIMFQVASALQFSVSVSVLGLSFSEVSFKLNVDEVSTICLVMLVFCGLLALRYCYHYFGGSDEAGLLCLLMASFLLVMGFLIFTGNVLFSLILWEYLGLVSFYLIMFYSNTSSLRASLITVFVSRFGDVSLFFLVLWSLYYLDCSLFFCVLFSSLVVLSKSACFPFISWLLEAMRAPTPVSSLVHSSTLVAAGAWFLFRYSWYFDDATMSLFFVLSVVTVLVSGICALFFYDLKKLVALSTCNNISWCLVFFVCGNIDLALVQLVSHGLSKCCFFMCIGDLMSSSDGSQSCVGVYPSNYTGKYSVFVGCLLVSSLCGTPFLGVYFTKHSFFGGVFYIYGAGYFWLMVICFMLSSCYSMRFALLMVVGTSGSTVACVCHYLLVVFLSYLSTVINILGFSSDVEDVTLDSFWSYSLLIVQIIGLTLGTVMYFYSASSWSSSSLFYSDCVVSAIYNSYLLFSDFCKLCLFRWETYFLDFCVPVINIVMLRNSLSSFNFLMLLVLFCLVFGLVVFC